MNLRQLRYLVALADERHFTRAAAREHVAQPALSQQIRSLEAELGLALVQRTTRRVSMTEAGEVLVARARRALAELDAGQAELQSLAGVQAGRLSVGALHTMGPIDLSLLLATFHARYPAIELTVREQSSEELAAMLREDEIDLAFLSVTERIQSRGLTLCGLVSEELVVVLATDHPLGTRDGLRLRDLAGEPFISFREGARLRELLMSAAADAGFEPRITLESNESRRIRSLVSRGLGVAILPRSDAEGPGSQVAVCALVQPPLTRDVTLASRAERRPSPAAEAFLTLTLEVYPPPTAPAT
ncbi:MAG TPA: LysR substrate-binding domain-containing protein [Solirubrobacteraceae bacterium]|jgi:DNA-binding transcriptional LysR family regulator|nr:LysR substrate-binding domain-containing protein [Solirubrobacteraceae bacterium]